MRPGRTPRQREESLAAVELELVAERANALGRAGDRLERALARWRDVADRSAEDRGEAFDDLVDAAWSLIVQRDCAGVPYDNLRWIRRYYDLPAAVLRRL